MRRTTVVGLLAVPLSIAGLYWLMLHGFLQLAAILLVVAVLGMIVAAVWEWRHGHRKWASLLLAGALLTSGAVGYYGWNLNHQLDKVDRIAAPPGFDDEGQRPKEKPTKALNILLMGADNPDQNVEKPTVAEELADGKWDVGAYRSDTIMVVHIPADRKTAYVVSIPRDSYVPIYDESGKRHSENKINAAFSEYGPFGTLRTVEKLTGLRMNHLAVIDYEGFRDLTTAIGGVDVYVPETVYDSYQDQTWEKGWNHLEGNRALKYVRQRHGLTNGDFDRVARQQNFLRAVMEKTLDDGTIGNPVTFTRTLAAITSHLTVDDDFSNGEIRSLALSLDGLDAKKVKFVTLPLDHYETVETAGSVNIIDAARAKELWRAVGDDTMSRYLQKYPDDELGDQRDVS
ncbi:putative cell envelope-related transcriptional attenuator [metagenome]|uniref:Putative cell envelope-related transcriptional attenuator n=1 Tax=metagenome TaxID=256318 RepID=A0A2P2CCM4_9ZZZZ